MSTAQGIWRWQGWKKPSPLREAYPDAPLFELGYTPDRLLETAVEQPITLTIFTTHQAQLLSDAAKKRGGKAKVYLKVETGFNRLGTDDPDELRAILCIPYLDVEGIYSHPALKDRPSDEIQLKKFLQMVEALEAKGIISATDTLRTASARWIIPTSGWI